MTLQQLLDGIKRLTRKGDVNDTSDVVTDTILFACNLARRDVQLLLPKHYLRKTGTISVVQGTATYSLASDVQKAYLFRYTVNSSEYFLEEVDSEEEFYKLVYSASASQNRPKCFFDAGLDGSGNKQIIVFPTPDAAYTVNYSYYKTWTTDILTTSNLASQIPEIPVHVHNVVFHGTMYYFLKAFDDPQQQVAKGEFEQAKVALNQAENEEASDQLAFRWGNLQVRYPGFFSY